jgi:type IV pilus assembly protein PilC
MGYIYNLKHKDRINPEKKYFNDEYEIQDYISSNKYNEADIDISINYLSTLWYWIKVFFKINSEHLSDKDLLQVVLLVKKIKKNNLRVDEQIVILNNYVKYDKRYKKLNKALLSVEDSLERGVGMAEALKVAGVPRFITETIKAGEESSELDEILDKLSDFLKTKIETESSISKMLLMPKISFSFVYGYFLLIVFYMAPKSRELGDFLDPEKYPDITKTIFSLSDTAIANPIQFIIISILILIFTYKIVYLLIAKITKYIPYVKDVFIAQDFVLMSALLSATLKARISLSQAIADVSEVVADKNLRALLEEMSVDIAERGKDLKQSLEDLKFDRSKISFYRDFYMEVLADRSSANLEKVFESLYVSSKEHMKEVVFYATTFINPIVLIIIASCLLTLYYAINAPLLTFSMDSM